jgi:hypothetical protein
MTTEEVTFEIGDRVIALGPLPIWSLKQCWGDIMALASPSDNPFDRCEVHCNIIASGARLHDDKVTGEVLFRSVTWEQSQKLGPLMVTLLHISGFAPKAEGDPDAQVGEILATVSP